MTEEAVLKKPKASRRWGWNGWSRAVDKRMMDEHNKAVRSIGRAF